MRMRGCSKPIAKKAEGEPLGFFTKLPRRPPWNMKKPHHDAIHINVQRMFSIVYSLHTKPDRQPDL